MSVTSLISSWHCLHQKKALNQLEPLYLKQDVIPFDLVCTLSNKETLCLRLDGDVGARIDGYVAFFILFVFEFYRQQEKP